MSTLAVDSITDAVGSGAPAFPNGVSGNIVTTGNLTATDLTLSGGVYLGGTGAANKLDGYEEGTWTPIIKATGGSTTAALTAYEPTYTKIGRLVYVSTFISAISWSDITDGSLVILAGLPYAANANNYGPIILSHNNTNIAGGYIENGGHTYFSNASGSEFAQVSNSITGNSFMFAATYNTTT